MHKAVLFLFLLTLLVIAGCDQQLPIEENQTNESNQILPISCSKEAKQCPDGSLVARNASNGCEFDQCPVIKRTSDTSYEVPVLILKYFPLKDQKTIDDSETGLTMTLSQSRTHISTLNRQLAEALEKGSTYHGYKDTDAKPALDYEIIEEKEFLNAIPISEQFFPFPDHIKLLTEIDICNYVENRNVKEIWIWMYHTDKVVPIESNMAGPYGDISNSYRQADLPVCNKTYTVYDYNYGRGLGEALEYHGHQVEALWSYAGYDLFLNKFVRPHGQEQPAVNHCGSIHRPPNAKNDYDWFNQSDAISDCEDWKPEGGGQTKTVNCHTWSKTDNCYSYTNPFDDGNVGYKIWWMQNVPGRGNKLAYNGCQLRNWWDFVGDFDKANQDGKSLTIC